MGHFETRPRAPIVSGAVSIARDAIRRRHHLRRQGQTVLLGRGLSLLCAMAAHLEEPEARILFESPHLGVSVLEPAPLYGHGPELPRSAFAETGPG